MKPKSFQKIFSLVLIFVVASNFIGTPAFADEMKGTTTPTTIEFYNNAIDFGSFLYQDSKFCRGTTCDWRTSKFGSGSINYSMCDVVDEKNCIESVEISSSSKEFTSLTLFSELNWTAINIDSASLQMTGGAPSIWTSTDENGKVKYFLISVYSSFAWNSENRLNGGDPFLDSIEMRIMPVDLAIFGSEADTRYYCTQSGVQNCFKESDFELEQKLRVSLNTPTSIGGFFMGRMSDPSVQQSLNAKTNQNEIQLTASPVRVPLISVKIPETVTVPSSLTRVRLGEVNRYPAFDGSWNEYFDFASKFTNDRVTKYSSLWAVYAKSPEYSNYLQCGRSVKGFLGTGTTNAMRYDYNPPVCSDGSFIFKLSGQHYQPDGVTLELGQYELVLSSEFARCLYKSGNAPLVAKIEITDANGEKNITTTTSQERDGWFRLQVAALTFSTKTIKVSLSPETPIVVAPVIEAPKVTPPSPKALKTIVCKKGVKTKTVKGVKPVCPKGWKIAKKS